MSEGLKPAKMQQLRLLRNRVRTFSRRPTRRNHPSSRQRHAKRIYGWNLAAESL